MKYTVIIFASILSYYIHIPHVDGDEFWQYYVAKDTNDSTKVISINAERMFKPGDTAIIDSCYWATAKDTVL